MRISLAILLTAWATTSVQAAVTSKEIEYDVNGTKCKGVLYYNPELSRTQAGVLVFHEWWGLNDDAKKRAKMVAEMGYAAFCADMYGDGKTTEHPADAKKFTTSLRENEKEWQARAEGALKVLQDQVFVDKTKIAAIGYCFGGTTALTLALSGADLKSVITFHAGLPAPTPEQAKRVKGQILVCNGADDGFIPAEAIKKFRDTLDAAKVKYEFVNHPGAVHSFTVKSADEKNLPGMKYNADADKKSWDAMTALLKETLK